MKIWLKMYMKIATLQPITAKSIQDIFPPQTQKRTSWISEIELDCKREAQINAYTQIHKIYLYKTMNWPNSLHWSGRKPFPALPKMIKENEAWRRQPASVTDLAIAPPASLIDIFSFPSRYLPAYSEGKRHIDVLWKHWEKAWSTCSILRGEKIHKYPTTLVRGGP